jgi:hypothetical protein
MQPLQVMNESHVDSVLLLAVPFHQDADFDFGKQTITQDIQVQTNNKEIKIFLTLTKYFPISAYIRKPFFIYDFATAHSEFPYM